MLVCICCFALVGCIVQQFVVELYFCIRHGFLCVCDVQACFWYDLCYIVHITIALSCSFIAKCSDVVVGDSTCRLITCDQQRCTAHCIDSASCSRVGVAIVSLTLYACDIMCPVPPCSWLFLVGWLFVHCTVVVCVCGLLAGNKLCLSVCQQSAMKSQ